MTIDLNAPFDSPLSKVFAYVVWIFGSASFIVGLWAAFPPESGVVEAFVLLCIVFAQANSIKNYRHSLVTRNFAIICAISYWSIGFMLRRLDVIGTGVYAIMVVTFLLSVAFVRLWR